MEVPARYYLQFPRRLFLPVPVPVPVEVRQPANPKLITRVKLSQAKRKNVRGFPVKQRLQPAAVWSREAVRHSKAYL